MFVLDHFCAIQNDDSQNNNSRINIGTGSEISIKDLCLLIKNIVNYNGSFYFNDSKPDGTMRKLIDIEKDKKMGWETIYNLR